VVMDDFLYAEPAAAAVPKPSSIVMAGLGLVGGLACIRRRRKTN
jgi:MYXO-CTERM domain-containing protein